MISVAVMLSQLSLPRKIVIHGEVGVSIGHGNIAVTYHFFCILERCPRQEQILAERMTEIVEMKILDACQFESVPPCFVEAL